MKSMLLSLAVAILFATSAVAKIIRVQADKPTIQAAINAAAKGDTVLVADGTYYENIKFKGKAITVASHFLMDADTSHISKTIINGSWPSHPDSGSVVYFISGEDTNSVLYGFTITGGKGTIDQVYNDRGGAGIFMNNSGGRVSYNRIVNNIITHKGVFGVGVLAGSTSGQYAIIENNAVHSNTGSEPQSGRYCEGGGIAVDKEYAGEVKIINNRIYNNTLISNGGYVRGAGIYCLSFNPGGKVTVNGNIVSDNECQPFEENQNHSGAGIDMHNIESKLFNNRIVNNRFIGNHGFGGGATVWGAQVEIHNNIVAGNSAKHGGGIYFGNIPTGSIKFANNTVIGNTAGYQGGGIFVSYADPVVLNTILWNNSAPNEPEIFLWQSHITVRYSDVQGGWSGEGNINADPVFADPLFHLADSSPCINKGIDSLQVSGTWYYCPPHDIAGQVRPFQGTLPDMGAYETPIVTAVAADRSAEVPEHFALHQNHPNPFNPSTTIEFALPKSSFVTLKIYNLLGEEVATLVAEKLPAGEHRRVWEAKGLASGVYVYRIQAGEFMQTRKLILLR